MRKKLSVLCTTFLLPLLMTVLAFAADSPFSDVAPDAPCAESIAYLVEHGKYQNLILCLTDSEREITEVLSAASAKPQQ